MTPTEHLRVLRTDESAVSVGPIDRQSGKSSVARNPIFVGMLFPNIGNLDLDWLLRVYLSRTAKTKQAIVSSIFNIESIPAGPADANCVFRRYSDGHEKNFDLRCFPRWTVRFAGHIHEGRKRVESVGACDDDWLDHYCQVRNLPDSASQRCSVRLPLTRAPTPTRSGLADSG